MLNFCTLFDSKFLPYGLNLHHSLSEQCDNFHLYIFAFDDKCFQILSNLKLARTTVISLSEFEDEKLLAIKPTRSKAEYCWTCTPSTILYCLKTFRLDNCTYIDSDIFFYDNPIDLINEMGQDEILLTLHRYTPKYDQSDLSGKFCVQFMTFYNKSEGIAALNWWRDACIDWCYARAEDGKFGDQKYLDDWEARFRKVHVLQNPGGAIAPWNIQQYKLKMHEDELYVSMGNQKHRLNFYHFHGLRFLSEQKVNLCEYNLSADVINLIYAPYISLFLTQYHKLKKIDPSLDMLLPVRFNFTTFKTQTFNLLTGRNNIYSINELLENGKAY